MLEPDVREQHDARSEDVRRVETTSKPCFDDRDVDSSVGEGDERGGGDDLELRRFESLCCGADACDHTLEVGLGAVQPDPLRPAGDVRRDRRADGEPHGEKQLLDSDRRGRLAVRADHVDRRIRVLRVAELSEENAHAVEPEAVPRPRAHRVEPLDG